MKRILLVVAMAVPLISLATEVLVLTTAGGTRVDSATSTYRRGCEVQNLGPNAIYCAVGSEAPVSTKSRQVVSGEAWAINVRAGVPIKCIVASTNQATGAATIVTEAR
jgi:hypothetical protein